MLRGCGVAHALLITLEQKASLSSFGYGCCKNTPCAYCDSDDQMYSLWTICRSVPGRNGSTRGTPYVIYRTCWYYSKEDRDRGIGCWVVQFFQFFQFGLTLRERNRTSSPSGRIISITPILGNCRYYYSPLHCDCQDYLWKVVATPQSRLNPVQAMSGHPTPRLRGQP